MRRARLDHRRAATAMMALAHRARRAFLTLSGASTHGVKIMAFNPAGDILLVRHRYARPDLFMLPGGGIERGESPDQAARRELFEETRCDASGVEAIGIFASSAEGRRDTVYLFRATTIDAPIADGVELVEAGFFALSALPRNTSPATRRRIDEMTAGRPSTGIW